MEPFARTFLRKRMLASCCALFCYCMINCCSVKREERKWRQWADKVLVHTLSPNAYRTLSESFESFNWFSQVGEWDRLFSALERTFIVYVGGFAMWIIGKRIRDRYRLKEDVRQSLYDEANHWLKEIRRRGGTFHGGNNPDLADLAVFGVLSSIEGCTAFKDLLASTKLGTWYEPMKRAVKSQSGSLPSYISGYR